MRRWMVPAALLALFALGAAWFFTRFELAPARQWVGPSGEARRNEFLAIQRFAERMGMRANPIRALPQLDALPTGSVLLLPAGRQAIDPRRLRRLVQWAEDGGHLVVEAELPGVADPLLDFLGVQRRHSGRGLKPPPVQTRQGRRLKVSLGTRTLLQLPENAEVAFSAGGRAGTLVASLQAGRGMITVASSLDFARNRLIGDHDNAEFVWHLLELAPAGELHLFVRQERLSLWSFLLEHALPVLVSATALLGLWLWHIGPRFGPRAPDAPPARRRLLDHLRASGRYYWAKGLRPRLVLAARDAALRHVAQLRPDFAQASDEERARHIAALISVSPEEARRFIAAADAAGGAEFVRLVHAAQRIHSALDRGNR